jgi:hypothetical protein
MLANAKWHTISWRTGTKGKLKARCSACWMAAYHPTGPAAFAHNKHICLSRDHLAGRSASRSLV